MRISMNPDQVGMSIVPPNPMTGFFSLLYQNGDRYAQLKFMQNTLNIVNGMRQSNFFSTERPDTWEKLNFFMEKLMDEYVKIRVVSNKRVFIRTSPPMKTTFELSVNSNSRALANCITTANLYKTGNTYITLLEFITRCEKYFGFSIEIDRSECTDQIAYINNNHSNCKKHELAIMTSRNLARLANFFLKVIYDETLTRDKRLNAIFAFVFLYGSKPHVIYDGQSMMGGAFATDFLLQYLLASIGEKPIRKNYLTLTEIELLFLFAQDKQDAWDTPRKWYLKACNNNDSNLLFHQGDSLSLLKMLISDDLGLVTLAKKHSEERGGQFHHVLFKVLVELLIEHRQVYLSNSYIPIAHAIKEPEKIMEEIAKMKESILFLQPDSEQVFDRIYEDVCRVLTSAEIHRESAARSKKSAVKSVLEKIQKTKPSCREELLLHIEMAQLSADNANNEKHCLNACARLMILTPLNLETFIEKCRIFDINYMKTLHHRTLELLLEGIIENKKLSIENIGIFFSFNEGQKLLADHWDVVKPHLAPIDLSVAGERPNKGALPYLPESLDLDFSAWDTLKGRELFNNYLDDVEHHHVTSVVLHQRVTGEGPYKGASPFHFLTGMPGGRELLAAHWDDIKHHLTSDGLHQCVTGKGPDEGRTPFHFLTGMPGGRELLAAHWDDIKHYLTSAGLHQCVTAEGPDEGKTPFYFLTCTLEGLQLLAAHWDDIKHYLTSAGLHQCVTAEGPDEGTSPFYFLTWTSGGQQLLAAHWDDFKHHLTSAGLHQCVTGKGPDEGKTPFYFLTCTSKGLQLLAAHWDDIKHYLTSAGLHQCVTAEGPGKGTSPFYFLTGTSEGQQLLAAHWDDFKHYLTSAGLHQRVTGEGRDKGASPFYCLARTSEGRELLVAHWHDFLTKGFDKRHHDEFNMLINISGLPFETKEEMCRLFLEKFKDCVPLITHGVFGDSTTAPKHPVEIDNLITIIKALMDNKFKLNYKIVGNDLEICEKLTTELNKYKKGEIDSDTLIAFIDKNTENNTNDVLKIYIKLTRNLAETGRDHQKPTP